MRRAYAAKAARQVGAWWFISAVVLAAVGFVVDGALLVAGGARASSALGGAVAAAGLGALLAGPLAIGLAAIAAGVHAAAVRFSRPGACRFALVALLALVPAWRLLEPSKRAFEGAYVLLALVTALAIGLAAWLSRARRPWLARVAAGLIGAAAVAADVWLSPTMYLELHNVAHLVTAAALAAALTPVRDRIAAARMGVLAMAVVGVVGGGLAATWIADVAAPGWRSASLRHGRHATRLARGLRAMVDRDGDGYSPVAWGGDCDDTDGARHPLAGDAPGGGDANCNGVDPPANPGDDVRGLAPPRGVPHLPHGDIDLVLLITIDTIRSDVLVPGLMPRLTQFAERGATFERAYAAGGSTNISLPLLHRSADDSPFVAPRLAADDIALTTVFSAGYDPKPLGFDRLTRTADDAESITDGVLARVRDVGSSRHFVWAHYYGPHEPTQVRDEVGVPEARPDLPESYRSEIRYVDRAIGRLLDSLEADGRLARAVVIVTGDHGEGFGEHGVYGHSRSGYDVVLRVPGVFVAPGVRPGRYAQLVSHRDVPATVLGAFGLADEAKAAEWLGRSWLRLRGAPDALLHEFVVARSDRFSSGRDAHAKLAVLVRDDGWKLVAGLEEELLELYALNEDPAENADRSPDEAALARELWRSLATACDVDGYPRHRPRAPALDR